MKEETLRKQRDMIDVLQNDLGLVVTNTNFSEYIRGDPTSTDAAVTGVEIEVTCFIQYDEEDGDENPYRVK